MNKKRIVSFSVTSFAADGITQRLNALKSKYPEGYYLNHKISTSSDSH